jgi:hypothetical protein
MVLIEKSDIENMMKTYNTDMRIAREICNASKKITCKYKPNSTQQDLKKCDIPDPSCNQIRKYIHDFNVIEHIDDPSLASPVRKYIIKGSAIPVINDKAYPTMLNQSLFDEKNINFLCGDTYNYGQPNLPKEHGEIMVIERDEYGIQGTKDQLITIDEDGKKKLTPIIDPLDPSGKVKKIPTYIGISEETCGSYQRVSLYTDIMDPHVLEFEPILVST